MLVAENKGHERKQVNCNQQGTLGQQLKEKKAAEEAEKKGKETEEAEREGHVNTGGAGVVIQGEKHSPTGAGWEGKQEGTKLQKFSEVVC